MLIAISCQLDNHSTFINLQWCAN